MLCVMKPLSFYFTDVFKAIADDAAAQGRRAYLWLAVAFGAGVCVYFSLPFEPLFCVTAGALTMSAFLLYDCRKNAFKFFATLVFLGVSGFAAAQIKTISTAAPMLKYRTRTVATSGIVDAAFVQGERQTVVLKDVKIASVRADETPYKIRLTLKNAPALEAGDFIEAPALLSPLPLPVYPDGADMRTIDFFNHVGARASARKPPQIVRAAQKTGFVEKTRQSVRKRLEKSSKQAELSIALLLGNAKGVPEDVITAYRNAGIAHLLAVSGVHMSLAAGIVYGAVSFLLALFPSIALRFNVRKIAAVCAVGGAAFYLMLSGAPVSARRAFVMAGFMFFAVVVNRRAFSLYTLAWAAFFLLLLSPESVLSVGFQLSFGAVLGLICLCELFPRCADPRAPLYKKIGYWIAGAVLADVAAVAATLPLSLHYFNYMPAYSVLGNLIAAPLAAFLVMPFLFAALLLMPFGAEKWALSVSDFGLTLINKGAFFVSNLPRAVLRTPEFPMIFALAGVCGMLFLCLWRTKARYAGAIVWLCGFTGLLIPRAPDFLLDSNASFYAFKDDAGDLRMRDKGNPFARKIWAAQNGQDGEDVRTASEKRGYEGLKTRFSCRDKLCVYENAYGKIVWAKSKKAAVQACATPANAYVFTASGDPPCDKETMFVKRDFSQNGTHAFYLDKDGLRVKKAKDGAFRPWHSAFGKPSFF